MTSQNSDNLRIPPSQSGLKRQLPMDQIQKWSEANAARQKRLQENVLKQKTQKSLFKKLMPYLLTGGSTGAGLGIGLSDLFF